MPKVSIAIPHHDTPKSAFFLARLLKSLSEQTFTDYEIVLVKAGEMAKTHNEAIKASKGEIIKIMQMDDYFAHPYALQRIVDGFTGDWMITGCVHTLEDVEGTFNPHLPSWNEELLTGNNTLGGFSTLSLRNHKDLPLMDERMSWLVDCDYYWRLKDKYGLPTLLEDLNVVVDVRNDRLTHTIPDEVKQEELALVLEKHDSRKI